MLGAVVGIVLAAGQPLSECGKPYCLSGYDKSAIGYDDKDSALADASRMVRNGFPIEVWTKSGKRIFPETNN
jgi:hypothetical protein